MGMARRAIFLALFLVLVLRDAPARAQLPHRPMPPAQLPPLLFVKLIGPKGMQATFFRAGEPEKSVAAPCTIGIRPGYAVRMALSGMADDPNAVFFPTLE